jgi:GNAT superfamily N-acetyltransferase
MAQLPASAELAGGAVERLGPAAAGEILTVQRAAFVTEPQLHNDMNIPPLTETPDELHAALARPDIRAWGVREEGLLNAAVRVELDRDLAHLGRPVVAPDRQGQGWGTRPLVSLEQRLPGTVAAIALATGEHSTANLRLYRRWGYVETGRSAAGSYEWIHLRKNLRDHVRTSGIGAMLVSSRSLAEYRPRQCLRPRPPRAVPLGLLR